MSAEPGQSFSEQVNVAGEELVGQVRQLVHEGNVRHLVIKNEGKIIMEIPVTVGLIGLALAPLLAAVAAAGALLTNCSIEIIRDPEAPAEPTGHAEPKEEGNDPEAGPNRTHLD